MDNKPNLKCPLPLANGNNIPTDFSTYKNINYYPAPKKRFQTTIDSPFGRLPYASMDGTTDEWKLRVWVNSIYMHPRYTGYTPTTPRRIVRFMSSGSDSTVLKPFFTLPFNCLYVIHLYDV